MSAGEKAGGSGNQAYHAQVLASLTSGVLIVDANGALIECNAAACRHLGLPPDGLPAGMSIASTLETAHLAPVLDEMRAQNQPMMRREFVLGNGPSARTLGFNASPLRGPDGFQGAIILFTDLTEVRRLEHDAAIHRQLAEIGELTAGVVHELRNPIASIMGLSELIVRKAEEGTPVERWGQRILSEADGLRVLVDRFLSLSKPFDPQKVRCDADKAVARAVQLCATLAQAREVTVAIHWESAPPVFRADEGLLVQAVSNLIRNAIEFSISGQTVQVSANAEGGELHVRIEDTGPGIAPELVESGNLFKPFISKREGGTGLGLSIVQRAINAHGGTVSCRNRESGGACFEIRLPLLTVED